MASRRGALAAVNGGFFRTEGPYRGEPGGIVLLDGKVLSEPSRRRVGLAVTNTGARTKLAVVDVDLRAEVVAANEARRRVDGINRPRLDDELVLFTPAFNGTTLTGPAGVEAVVAAGRVVSALDAKGDAAIPRDGWVASAHGASAVWVRGNMKKGAPASLRTDALERPVRVTASPIASSLIRKLVEVTTHRWRGGPPRSERSLPGEFWAYRANLAYGVTTMHDPSATSWEVFTQAEMVEAGELAGPRVYSTGAVLYGAGARYGIPIKSLGQARRHVRRMKRLGAISVKRYMQPRREQRQWVLQAAREESVLVVPEGGGKFEENLGMVMDRHTAIEHALPITPIHRDVVQLFSKSKTGYTPTLLVAYGGLSGEHWFYQHYDVFDDAKLRRFTPRPQ